MFVVMPMETTLQVIAEPRRQAILDLLRDGGLPVGELVERLGMSQPLVSKHLRVLKDAGLVQVRADAQRRLYRIRPEPLAELGEWLPPPRALSVPRGGRPGARSPTAPPSGGRSAAPGSARAPAGRSAPRSRPRSPPRSST